MDVYGFIKNVVYRQIYRLFDKGSETYASIAQFARQAGARTGRVSELIEHLVQKEPLAAACARECLNAFQPRLILNRVRNRRQITKCSALGIWCANI